MKQLIEGVSLTETPIISQLQLGTVTSTQTGFGGKILRKE
jgi:hypothetical protein